MLECGHILFPYEITATLQWPANQNEKSYALFSNTTRSSRHVLPERLAHYK